MVKSKQQKKIKILAYCDAPTCATGFASVSRNILTGLYNTGRYSIDILGINYWGDPHNFPFRIWPIGMNNEKDPYGRKKSFDMIQKMDYDILFFLQDSFIMEFLPALMQTLRASGKKFKSICYYPIDGRPKEQWLKNVDACDYTVAYSEFGKNISKEVYPSMKDPYVISHGANVKDYHILNDKEILSFKNQFFGPEGANKFVVTNVNRNQPRKDIPRTIAAFAEFHKAVPNSLLYLHMAKKDFGWDLPPVVENFGLKLNTDVIFPENFGPNQGYPRNVVNMIYNISDCIVSTTIGEGWGLSWSEAMATNTPVIFPDNTALTENITEDRGWLVKSGGDPNLYTVLTNDNEVIRPLVDVNDMTAKMLEVYNNRDEAKRRAKNAYEWVVTKMDWQTCIVPQWIKLFDEAYSQIGKTDPNALLQETMKKVINTETF